MLWGSAEDAHNTGAFGIPIGVVDPA